MSKIPKTLQSNFSDRKIVYCVKGEKILTEERDYLLIPHLVLNSNNKTSILFPKPKESITIFLKKSLITKVQEKATGRSYSKT